MHLHFISGLPRSGSTLLAAILRQNPRFHAAMSGPMAGLVDGCLELMSGRNEFSVFIKNEQRQRMLAGLFEGYYRENAGQVIFDTNRAWCAKMDLIAALFPKAKVVACVRHVPWILDSVERYARKNCLQPSMMFEYKSGGTVYMHINALTSPTGLLGYAYDALRQAVYGCNGARLLIVQYESLSADPQKTMDSIYAFLEERPFVHDFTAIQYDAPEYDGKVGAPGLHTVRRELRAEDRATILPADLFKRFANHSFWRNPHMFPAGVRVV